MKKITVEKSFGFIIHIDIEMSHGNTLCHYLSLKQGKMSCFSFYLFSFFYYNVGEQEGRTAPALWWWWLYQWEFEDGGESR
jgi:hypothetical protein